MQVIYLTFLITLFYYITFTLILQQFLVYVFAYSKKLSPKEETVTLFDMTQLKSFINGEVTGEQIIGVQPYAIQAEGLTADGLTENCKNKAIAAENDLKIIYQVIRRKVANS